MLSVYIIDVAAIQQPTLANFDNAAVSSFHVKAQKQRRISQGAAG